MPDLMLDEYRGLSRDELSQVLREAARKMYGNGWIERDFQVKENALRFSGEGTNANIDILASGFQ